ncbi:hypothetical protein FRB93_003823 [Tulasnella sp. JGI-2019a]|nr:hypothetical protein FRB93_003823 [Tulasnella sp. JGI-2019a]
MIYSPQIAVPTTSSIITDIMRRTSVSMIVCTVAVALAAPSGAAPIPIDVDFGMSTPIPTPPPASNPVMAEQSVARRSSPMPLTIRRCSASGPTTDCE